jgi:hypothetical protein
MRIRPFLPILTLVMLLSSLSGTARAQNAALGAWELTTQSPEGSFVSQLEVREEDGKLTAVGKSPQGERAYDSIDVEGSKIVLVITIDYNGTPLTITFRGEIADKAMVGDADFGGMATGTWSAEKK